MRYLTPLKKAKQLGSAKLGVGHWWSLRVSSIALIFLVGWFIYAAVTLTPLQYDTAIMFLRNPLNALLGILLILTTFYHGYLGIEEVIVDYVHCECTKLGLLIFLKLASVFAAAASLFSIFTIYFLG